MTTRVDRTGQVVDMTGEKECPRCREVRPMGDFWSATYQRETKFCIGCREKAAADAREYKARLVREGRVPAKRVVLVQVGPSEPNIRRDISWGVDPEVADFGEMWGGRGQDARFDPFGAPVGAGGVSEGEAA